MLSELLSLPTTIWITYPLLEETIVEQVTVIEATYDKCGYKSLYYQNSKGSLFSWNREHTEVQLFRTKQRAIDSIGNNNYSIRTPFVI